MKNIILFFLVTTTLLGFSSRINAQVNLLDGQKLFIKKEPKDTKMEGIQLIIKANMFVVEKSSNPDFKVGDIYAQNLMVFKKGDGFLTYKVELKNAKGAFERKLFYIEESKPNQIMGINIECATVVMRDGTRIQDCAYGSDPTIIVYL